MSAKERKGKILEKIQVGEDQIILRFDAVGPISFEAGQFLSLKVPQNDGFVWRPYSFAGSLERIRERGCELLIKYYPGGAATPYLQSLHKGDLIEFKAPYGDFLFKTGSARPVVFVATGTGLAPIRSMVTSNAFLEGERPFSVAILGFRKPEDIPYFGELEKNGVECRYALSRECPEGNASFFSGRVTDFIRQIPDDFSWADCDYYLCGSKQMIEEVCRFLATKQVSSKQISFETFEASKGVTVRKKAA